MPQTPPAERCAKIIIDEEKVKQAQQRLLDGLSATRLAAIFKALADPTRVRIVSLLAHTELCVCDLAASLGMSQSAVSHQLSLMRELRVVKNRKEGRLVYYTLDDEHVRDLFRRGLEHIKHR
ncbi:MAG: helix-turn-helix transcriptional regulator [Anaerolineae bacterium]|nr:helix-turn-helix transcriptional regulator [Anaerolineae bacterium]